MQENNDFLLRGYDKYMKEIELTFNTPKKKYNTDFNIYRNIGQDNIKMKKFKALPKPPSLSDSLPTIADSLPNFTDSLLTEDFALPTQNFNKSTGCSHMTLNEPTNFNAIDTDPFPSFPFTDFTTFFGSSQIEPLPAIDFQFEPSTQILDQSLAAPYQSTKQTSFSTPDPIDLFASYLATPEQSAVSSPHLALANYNQDFLLELFTGKDDDILGPAELAFWNTPLNSLPLSPPSTLPEEPSYPIQKRKRKYHKQSPNSTTKLKPTTRFIRYWKPICRKQYLHKSPRFVISRIMGMLQKEQITNPDYLSLWEFGPPSDLDTQYFINKYMTN
ncbi:hypothetical protein HDV01_007107 [Terramyces sp. JEL0728]|nr:hypothetical protein HDV01_007107 [Terramyces sp. JEL0728]